MTHSDDDQDHVGSSCLVAIRTHLYKIAIPPWIPQVSLSRQDRCLCNVREVVDIGTAWRTAYLFTVPLTQSSFFKYSLTARGQIER